MTRRRRLLSAATASVALLMLGFVVAVAARSRPGEVEDDALFEFDGRLDIDLGGLAAWTIFVLAMLGAVLLAVGVKEMRPRRDPRRRSYLRVILGLAVFFVLLRVFQPIASDLMEAAESGGTGGQPVDTPLGSSGSIAWLFSLLVAAVVAAALTRVGLSVREVAYDDAEVTPPMPSPTRPALRASPLPLNEDPRSRVLAAYNRFEESASLIDLGRHRNETAGRHSARVRDAAELDPSSLAKLMRLFSQARFGLASVDEDDATAAETLSARLAGEMMG